jgi:hypothetical protein
LSPDPVSGHVSSIEPKKTKPACFFDAKGILNFKKVAMFFKSTANEFLLPNRYGIFNFGPDDTAVIACNGVGNFITG